MVQMERGTVILRARARYRAVQTCAYLVSQGVSHLPTGIEYGQTIGIRTLEHDLS